MSDVERSVVLWSMFAIGSALTYLLFSGNVPLLHTSRYIIPHDSVYQAFPRVSTASDKRWGEKAWVRGYLKPGIAILQSLHHTFIANIGLDCTLYH